MRGFALLATALVGAQVVAADDQSFFQDALNTKPFADSAIIRELNSNASAPDTVAPTLPDIHCRYQYTAFNMLNTLFDVGQLDPVCCAAGLINTVYSAFLMAANDTAVAGALDMAIKHCVPDFVTAPSNLTTNSILGYSTCVPVNTTGPWHADPAQNTMGNVTSAMWGKAPTAQANLQSIYIMTKDNGMCRKKFLGGLVAVGTGPTINKLVLDSYVSNAVAYGMPATTPHYAIGDAIFTARAQDVDALLATSGPALGMGSKLPCNVGTSFNLGYQTSMCCMASYSLAQTELNANMPLCPTTVIPPMGCTPTVSNPLGVMPNMHTQTAMRGYYCAYCHTDVNAANYVFAAGVTGGNMAAFCNPAAWNTTTTTTSTSTTTSTAAPTTKSVSMKVAFSAPANATLATLNAEAASIANDIKADILAAVNASLGGKVPAGAVKNVTVTFVCTANCPNGETQTTLRMLNTPTYEMRISYVLEIPATVAATMSTAETTQLNSLNDAAGASVRTSVAAAAATATTSNVAGVSMAGVTLTDNSVEATTAAAQAPAPSTPSKTSDAASRAVAGVATLAAAALAVSM